MLRRMKLTSGVRTARGATRSRCVVGLLALASTAAMATTATAAPAKTVTQTARDGALSARFTFVARRYTYGAETLTITDDGQVVYRAPVDAPQCGGRCAPGGGYGGTGSSVRFATLSAGAAPSLVLDLYSNDAHCCTIGQVFTPAADGGWSVRSHNFGDPGYVLSDLDKNGVDEFETGDDRFAYRFTDFAASGLPVQVLAFTGGQFQNVTQSYPSLISRDAQAWLAAFKAQRRGHYEDTTGVVAAWAADEDELGHSAAVNGFLGAQAKAKRLNSGLGNVVPQGARYVRALKRFLVTTGYLTT